MRKISKIASTIMAIAMMFSLLGCGNSKDNGDGAGTITEDNPYVSEVGGFNAPNMPIDPGADIAVATTTEEAPPKTGYYTYNVDGVEIKMNTNVDDFIHQDQYGYFVDLVGLAESVGYSNQSVLHQNGFFSDVNPDVEVFFEDLHNKDQDLVTVCFSSSDHFDYVSFMRADVFDDTIITYYISGDSKEYRVNYEQIVIFAFLLENGAYEPNDNWLEGLGFHDSNADNQNANGYYNFYNIFK